MALKNLLLMGSWREVISAILNIVLLCGIVWRLIRY